MTFSNELIHFVLFLLNISVIRLFVQQKLYYCKFHQYLLPSLGMARSCIIRMFDKDVNLTFVVKRCCIFPIV